MIEDLLPNVIGGKSSLTAQLLAVGFERGIPSEETLAVVRRLPTRLMAAECFLDRLTGFWRYEFEIPFDLEKTVVHGSDMWIPVTDLFDALFSAVTRLPAKALHPFLLRLANIASHKDALIEMIPASRAHKSTPMEFEVSGLGVGNRTIDWILRPIEGRRILLGLKNRIADFLQQVEVIHSGNADNEPTHESCALI